MINILEKSEIVALPAYYNPSFQADISKDQLEAVNNNSGIDANTISESQSNVQYFRVLMELD